MIATREFQASLPSARLAKVIPRGYDGRGCALIRLGLPTPAQGKFVFLGPGFQIPVETCTTVVRALV